MPLLCLITVQWLCMSMFSAFSHNLNTAVAVVCIYVIGNQWKLRDASDFVSYGNEDTQIEQWVSSWGAGRERPFWKARGFPAGSHIAPKCVWVCFCVLQDTNTNAKNIQHTRSIHTHIQIHKQVQICCYPLPVILHNGYCFWVFTHQYHWFPNKAETKTRQEMLCNDMCLYTCEHLAHNNNYVFSAG